MGGASVSDEYEACLPMATRKERRKKEKRGRTRKEVLKEGRD